MSKGIALGTGNTAVVSISIDLELLNQVKDIASTKYWNRSSAMRILIKYGIIYMKMLEEGFFDEKEPAKTD